MKKRAENFLPLSHTTFYILLTINEPLHSLEIMGKVIEMSGGGVTLGPGTLYGMLNKLEKNRLIEQYEVLSSDRRKSYVMTELGRLVVTLEYGRLSSLVEKCAESIEDIRVKLDA